MAAARKGSRYGHRGPHYDPDRLSPRLAGVGVVRSAMVAGRAGHRPATRPQGEERLAECPPDAGRRDTRPATPAARTGAMLDLQRNVRVKYDFSASESGGWLR